MKLLTRPLDTLYDLLFKGVGLLCATMADARDYRPSPTAPTTSPVLTKAA